MACCNLEQWDVAISEVSLSIKDAKNPNEVALPELFSQCLQKHGYKVNKNRSYKNSSCEVLKRISKSIFKSLKEDRIPGTHSQQDLALVTALMACKTTRQMIDPLYNHKGRHIILKTASNKYRLLVTCSIKKRRWVPSYKEIKRIATFEVFHFNQDLNKSLRLIKKQAYDIIKRLRDQSPPILPSPPRASWVNLRLANPSPS